MNTYYSDETSLGEATIDFLGGVVGSLEFWLGVMVTVFVILVVITWKRKVRR